MISENYATISVCPDRSNKHADTMMQRNTANPSFHPSNLTVGDSDEDSVSELAVSSADEASDEEANELRYESSGLSRRATADLEDERLAREGAERA